jgi:hypothetical protein
MENDETSQRPSAPPSSMDYFDTLTDADHKKAIGYRIFSGGLLVAFILVISYADFPFIVNILLFFSCFPLGLFAAFGLDKSAWSGFVKGLAGSK